MFHRHEGKCEMSERIGKGWITLEYVWRIGVRPLMWLVRIAVVAVAVGCISWMLDHGTTSGVFTFVALYAVWEIGRAIRSIKPMNISVTRGEKLIVQRGASVSVPKADLDRVIEAIARQEAAAAPSANPHPMKAQRDK